MFPIAILMVQKYKQMLININLFKNQKKFHIKLDSEMKTTDDFIGSYDCNMILKKTL